MGEIKATKDLAIPKLDWKIIDDGVNSPLIEYRLFDGGGFDRSLTVPIPNNRDLTIDIINSSVKQLWDDWRNWSKQ